MRWTTLDLLLAGSPHEILPGAERDGLIAKATRWMAHPSLTAEERERIQLVWLAGEHRPALQVTRQRWGELGEIAGKER